MHCSFNRRHVFSSRQQSHAIAPNASSPPSVPRSLPSSDCDVDAEVDGDEKRCGHVTSSAEPDATRVRMARPMK